MKNKDILWKGALEDTFDDFLWFWYPNADKRFDLSKGFEYQDKELEQLFPPEGDIYSSMYVDKLVKVSALDGFYQGILIHIEVQGYNESNFAKRMFQYYSRITDKYDMPITAFVIFTDTNKNFHPKCYERDFLGTKITYSFNTLKIIELDDAELAASNNPFAMVVLSAKLAILGNKKDQQLFENARDLIKRLLTKQISKKKINSILHFLRYYVNFEKTEMLAKFVEEIAILTERKTTMGIEELLIDIARHEGKKEGVQEGKMEKDISFTKNLLASTDFDVAKIAQLVGVSEDFVLKVKNS